MATIAHLTDLHLVENNYAYRRFESRARLQYLSFGRPLIPEARKNRVASALRQVWMKNVDHLLITGDLTEDGHQEQFEVLAELLSESRVPPERITLVPGNHDAYIEADGFAQALRGPLRPYAATSPVATALRFRDVTIVPVSTAFHQSPLRSAGAIASHELASLAAIATDAALAGRPIVFAQHHPPGAAFIPLVQWLDGLTEHSALSDLFRRCPHLHVMHGHTHRRSDRNTCKGEAARVFSARAVVDSASPLRLYEASSEGVRPLEADPIARREAVPQAG